MDIEITLTKHKIAVIDSSDLSLVIGHKWFAQRSRGTWYASTGIRINGKKTTIAMHRLLMNAAPGQAIDHKDGDGLNNRRANLRLATNTENGRNRHSWKGNKSGFKGVFFHKSHQKWAAQITIDKRHKYLGRFHSPEEAAKHYDAAAVAYFGPFAATNFPRKENTL